MAENSVPSPEGESVCRRQPVFSVVVATFNREQCLRRLLDSLSKQTLRTEDFEVIIVNDGSTDGTIEAINEIRKCVKNLRVLDLPNRGPAAARNSGARSARGRYLAFTDDDCVASPDWLENLLATFERTGAVGVQGRTETDRKARSPLSHEMEILSAWLTVVPTCNAAYLKEVFDEAGGFDERFPFAHDEDSDLAWRIGDLGAIVFEPKARIVHPPRVDRFGKVARWVRGFESDFLLFHKNPEKYRRYISRSPWWTIYWKVFIIAQLRAAKSNCRYLIRPFRPDYFVVGVAVLLARWFNLIKFFPEYRKASESFRRDFDGGPCQRLELVPGEEQLAGRRRNEARSTLGSMKEPL